VIEIKIYFWGLAQASIEIKIASWGLAQAVWLKCITFPITVWANFKLIIRNFLNTSAPINYNCIYLIYSFFVYSVVIQSYYTVSNGKSELRC
jgi:hypothetical protein